MANLDHRPIILYANVGLGALLLGLLTLRDVGGAVLIAVMVLQLELPLVILVLADVQFDNEYGPARLLMVDWTGETATQFPEIVEMSEIWHGEVQLWRKKVAGLWGQRVR